MLTNSSQSYINIKKIWDTKSLLALIGSYEKETLEYVHHSRESGGLPSLKWHILKINNTEGFPLPCPLTVHLLYLI
jgi:hypothetical protein